MLRGRGVSIVNDAPLRLAEAAAAVAATMNHGQEGEQRFGAATMPSMYDTVGSHMVDNSLVFYNTVFFMRQQPMTPNLLEGLSEL